MKKKWKLILGLALASLMVAGIFSGTALAADGEQDAATTTATATSTQNNVGNENADEAGLPGLQIAAVSDLLGMTPREIMTALEAGQSLSAIAADQGVTEAALVNAILEPNRTALQAKVDAGVIPAAVMEQRLAELEDIIVLAVQATDINPFGFEMGRAKTMQGEGRLDINDQAVLDLLGMTREEIRTARQAGQSLVEIAAAKNITEDQFVATILAEKKTVLDAKVAAGNLTQAAADEMLNQCEERITEQVNRTEAGPNNARITRGMGQFGTGPGDKMMGEGRGHHGDNDDADEVGNGNTTQSTLRSSRTNLPAGSATY